MTFKKRVRLWVDPSVQGALVVRVLVYWLACMVLVTLPLALIQAAVRPEQYLHQHYIRLLAEHWPVLAALTVIAPFFIYDTIRFSHQFTGPVYRLRRELERYELGENIFPIEVRKGDFWQDLIDRINSVVERAETAEEKLAELEAESPVKPPVCELPQDAVASEVTVG
jgi:hypothetical protein